MKRKIFPVLLSLIFTSNSVYANQPLEDEHLSGKSHSKSERLSSKQEPSRQESPYSENLSSPLQAGNKQIDNKDGAQLTKDSLDTGGNDSYVDVDTHTSTVNDKNTNIYPSTSNASSPSQEALEVDNNQKTITDIVKRDVVLQIIDDEHNPSKLERKLGYAYVEVDGNLKPKIINNTQGRILISSSINGINPVNGKKAILGDRGIIVEPNDSIIIEHGKISKKSKAVNIFEKIKDQGEMYFIVFFEKMSYPTLYPHMDIPPFEEAKFFINKEGVKQWIPPKNYPFRKSSERPAATFYINYKKR